MKMVEDAPDGTDQLALPESLYSFQSSSSRNVLRGFTLIVHPGDFCDQNYHPLVGSGLSISDNWSVGQKAECLPTAICRVVERALIFPLQSSEQFMNTNQKPLWIRRVRTALLGAIAGVAIFSLNVELLTFLAFKAIGKVAVLVRTALLYDIISVIFDFVR